MDQRVVGMWDVHHGPVFSNLCLAPDGSYRHALWDNSSAHWGSWSYETLNGQTVLIMRLAGAMPLMQMTPFGVQQTYWPAMEMWIILGIEENSVTLADGQMLRKIAQPAPMPPLPMPPFSAQPMPQPPASAPARPVVAQWHDAHTDWAAVRKIYQDIYTADQKTTNDLAAAQRAMVVGEIAARQANMTAMSEAISKGVPAFINAQKGIRSR